MLKMIAVKCAEADTAYKKIRQHLVKGDVTAAEKLLQMLDQMNSMILKDLQSELQGSASDIYEVIAALSEQVQKEKRQEAFSKS